MRCDLTTACQGAFVLCPTADTGILCDGQGRLAASDFTVPPGGSADVSVALTHTGEQVIGGPGGYRADVLIDLRDYGVVQIPPLAGQGSSTSPSGAVLDLRTTDKGQALPPGAVASCGGILFVGPNTSCGFALAVERAYAQSNTPAAVTATSPATGQSYTMHCTNSLLKVCTGATNASVIFY